MPKCGASIRYLRILFKAIHWTFVDFLENFVVLLIMKDRYGLVVEAT
jgi:hypothetical protein